MPEYRIKYRLYRIEGRDLDDAKRQICEIMKSQPEKFISVEVEKPKRGVLSRIVFGE
jgi:hypothetical protein